MVAIYRNMFLYLEWS